MAGEKYLIVNADDFGQSPGVNRGIMESHEHGNVGYQRKAEEIYRGVKNGVEIEVLISLLDKIANPDTVRCH